VGLIAAPLAWSLQELLGYGLSARACGAAPGVGVAELIVAVGAVLVAGTGLVVSRGAWRRVGGDGLESEPGRASVRAGTDRFLALAGMLVSVIFLFGIVMNLAGYFLVPGCTAPM
jgi:hypothetical protein